MSLFDIIKYPITQALNREDVERLPYDILSKWCDAVSTYDSISSGYNEIDRYTFDEIYNIGNVISEDERKEMLCAYITFKLKTTKGIEVIAYDLLRSMLENRNASN